MSLLLIRYLLFDKELKEALGIIGADGSIGTGHLLAITPNALNHYTRRSSHSRLMLRGGQLHAEDPSGVDILEKFSLHANQNGTRVAV